MTALLAFIDRRLDRLFRILEKGTLQDRERQKVGTPAKRGP